jgi:cytochrome c-type biogenesis protein
VFIVLGSLFGLGGGALIKYRFFLSQMGGVLVILFGLSMVGVLRLPSLNIERRISNIRALTPGNPTSALLFGATFAFGWTPCVGPILGSILTLAAVSATVGQGAFLLFIFSLGLAAPFLIIAAGIGSASVYIAKLNKYLHIISIIGGLFLIFLGILLLTNQFGVWLVASYRLFDFINYERLLDYL